MSIDVLVKAQALVSATIERKAPDAFAVLKEAANRTRNLALDAKNHGVSQEIVDTSREIAKSLEVLATAFDSTFKVEGDSRSLTVAQFCSYLNKEVSVALASEDPLEEFTTLAKLKAALDQATIQESGEILMIFTGEIEGSKTIQDVSKSIDDSYFPAADLAWPADMNRR